MFLVRTPRLLQALWPDRLWHMPRDQRMLYLTFDDGPTPIVTPKVLALLERFGAKATFFCIGDKVQRYPEILDQVQAAGHSIGNHTQHHVNGWKTESEVYLDDAFAGSASLEHALGRAPSLFRPPYGRIKNGDAKQIAKREKVVMWEVLSGDFEAKWSKERVAENVIRNAKAGSIVVFHDSEKCAEKAVFALEKVLAHFSEAGYGFGAFMKHYPKRSYFLLSSTLSTTISQ